MSRTTSATSPAGVSPIQPCLTAGAVALGSRWSPRIGRLASADGRHAHDRGQQEGRQGLQHRGPGGRSGLVAQGGRPLSGSLLNRVWRAAADALAWADQGSGRSGSRTPGRRRARRRPADTHEFALTPGTHWMHSHTISEQQLLAAPMVTREKDAGDVQDVVVMLHDFAFRSPAGDPGGARRHKHAGTAHIRCPPGGLGQCIRAMAWDRCPAWRTADT